jgi:hypothetical protein
MSTDNPDEIKAEIQHLRALQKTYRRRHRATMQSVAEFDKGLVPSHLTTGIEELKENIEGCDNKITELKAQIIRPHKHELEAFYAMQRVLSDASAAKWIIMGIVQLTGGKIENPDVTTLRELNICVSGICLSNIERLQATITEVENL